VPDKDAFYENKASDSRTLKKVKLSQNNETTIDDYLDLQDQLKRLRKLLKENLRFPNSVTHGKLKMATELIHYSPNEDGKKIIFRAHWSYQGGPWYDHALVDYGECPVPKEKDDCMDEHDVRPSRILAFFKVESHHLKDASLVSAEGWHAVCSRTISPAFFREDENFRNNWNDHLEVQDQSRIHDLKEKHAAEQKRARKKAKGKTTFTKPKNNNKSKPTLPLTDQADKPYPTNYDQCPALFHLSKMELKKEGRTYSFPLSNAQKSKVNESEVIVRGGDNMSFVHGEERLFIVPVTSIREEVIVIRTSFSCERDRHGVMVFRNRRSQTWRNELTHDMEE